MDFGLTDETLELIRSVFERYSQISCVKVFGSRALNTYRPNSDVDLVCWGESDPLVIGSIKSQLDELPLPYLFDLQSYESISHLELKEHIDRHAKPLFVRSC